MTKKDLKEKMLEFIQLQSDNNLDDWYTTDRNAAWVKLSEFAETLNIEITRKEVNL